MKELIPGSLKARLEQARIMAVVVIDDIEDTIPVMKALTDGGINAIELALRTPASIEAAICGSIGIRARIGRCISSLTSSKWLLPKI